MDPPIVVAVISAASVAVVAPALSFYLTKKKEREADWQKYKFVQYQELVTALNGIVGTDATPEGNRRFAGSCNTLHLLASKAVIAALHEFQDEIRDSNTDKSQAKHDLLLAQLIWEIRTDLRIPGTAAASDFIARLWCSSDLPVQEPFPNPPHLVGKAAEEEERLRDPSSGFFTQYGIVAVIEKSGLTQPGEKIHVPPLLLFQTSKQRTWLAASNHRLFCVLDDEKERASGKLVQWILRHEEVTPVKARPKDPTGMVDIGPRKDWLYSARLHYSPEGLEKKIEDLLKPL
ncbi:MAG: hypothetical protein ABSF54_05505 [Bryobacteraceae bacterium]|jgi:hypothetical protein